MCLVSSPLYISVCLNIYLSTLKKLYYFVHRVRGGWSGGGGGGVVGGGGGGWVVGVTTFTLPAIDVLVDVSINFIVEHTCNVVF